MFNSVFSILWLCYVPEQSDGWTLGKKCVKNSPPQDSSGNRIVLYQLVKAS